MNQLYELETELEIHFILYNGCNNNLRPHSEGEWSNLVCVHVGVQVCVCASCTSEIYLLFLLINVLQYF